MHLVALGCKRTVFYNRLELIDFTIDLKCSKCYVEESTSSSHVLLNSLMQIRICLDL